jgi:sensor histidine kinase YesM
MTARLRTISTELLFGSGWLLFSIFWMARDAWARIEIPDDFPRFALAVTAWHGFWVLLTPLILALGRRFPPHGPSWKRNVLIHLAVLLLLVAVLSRLWLLMIGQPDPGFVPYLYDALAFYAYRFGTAFLIYSVTLAGGFLFDQWNEDRRRTLLRARLEHQLALIEMNDLRTRLDPELLTLTLEEIERACTSDPLRAELMIETLGDLIRITLQQIDRAVVPLSDEIDRAIAHAEIVSFVHHQVDLEVSVPQDGINPLVPAGSVIAAMRDLLMKVPSGQSSQFRIEWHPGAREEILVRRLALVAGENDAISTIPAVTDAPDPEQMRSDPAPEPRSIRDLARHILPYPSIRAILAFVAVVTFVRLTTRIPSEGFAEPLPVVLGYSFLAALVMAAAGLVMLALAGRIRIDVHPAIVLSSLFVSSFAVALIAEVAIFFIYPVWGEIDAHPQMSGFLAAMIRSRGVTQGHLVIMLISFAAVGVRYHQREHDLHLLPARISDATVRKLKKQLQPHFLFNSLNAILGLLRQQPAAAGQMTSSLRRFLGRSLRMESAREVTLAEELETLREYLMIEKHRLGDRLTVEISVAPELMSLQVPPLLLQPIAENAIVHGISRTYRPGKVLVHARVASGTLTIGVENTAPGAGPRSGPRGLGLATVRGLLAALYGTDATLQARPMPDGGFSTVVTMPARTSAAKGIA